MIKVRAADLQIGDRVDLTGDPIADPAGDDIRFETEYAVVIDVTLETPDCVVVSFDGIDAFGFPPNHLLNCEG